MGMGKSLACLVRSFEHIEKTKTEKELGKDYLIKTLTKYIKPFLIAFKSLRRDEVGSLNKILNSLAAKS
jgi:hypothetical protein